MSYSLVLEVQVSLSELLAALQSYEDWWVGDHLLGETLRFQKRNPQLSTSSRCNGNSRKKMFQVAPSSSTCRWWSFIPVIEQG